eukprot:3976371-Amphidinium_carterae.1
MVFYSSRVVRLREEKPIGANGAAWSQIGAISHKCQIRSHKSSLASKVHAMHRQGDSKCVWAACKNNSQESNVRKYGMLGCDKTLISCTSLSPANANQLAHTCVQWVPAPLPSTLHPRREVP